MNLVLDPNDLCVSNIFFMETKPNMIFDGIFTKINYCDEFFTMHGIYINISQKPDIGILAKLESDILNIYNGESKPLGSKPIFKLVDFIQNKVAGKPGFLKISGVWKNNNNEYGLSFLHNPKLLTIL